MKLAVYEVVVHAPDDWDEEEWGEDMQEALDDLQELFAKGFAAKLAEQFPSLRAVGDGLPPEE